MPGDPVVLVDDETGRSRSFVTVLARFPVEPLWVLVGGFAVSLRLARLCRVTNDVDALSES